VRVPGVLDLLVKLSALDLELLARRLGVAEEHLGVCVEEDGVLDVGVPSSQGSLHHNDLLGLPHVQHGHAWDGQGFRD
jgi:hypothetical protein